MAFEAHEGGMWGLVAFLLFAITNLRPSFVTIAQEANTRRDEELLQFYVEKWDRYIGSARFLNRLLTDSNQDWVKQEREAGKMSVHRVDKVCVIPAYFWTAFVFLGGN